MQSLVAFVADLTQLCYGWDAMDRARPPSSEPRRRTGGRSARVVNDVLDAVLDLLARAGYARMTFDAVAERAGVSKTTVYRRWPTKADLVRAALLRLVDVFPKARDTGTLRGDLIEVARVRLLEDTRGRERAIGLLRANMGVLDDPELRALGRLVTERANQPIVAAVERSIVRGELPRGTDPELVIEPIYATLQFHVFVRSEQPSLAYIEQLVDLVLAGARAGAAVRRAER
ncbi:transcriptional regulator, TetR family [Anaeromyxobacter dehalogenans 2CP-1]|uniref:Transcriptional regulator, TetR family n=1 Tax=Anaeromyxobacter dehalogenans (strain ATCC BAA-258 / DSM 21875 / 2CP-1) TaxID=455488 RepID=B8JC80_ANAD2|nr:transcriptional regulator, TetR family [Anaeromyxobacter dehalogenans 2CP-1]